MARVELDTTLYTRDGAVAAGAQAFIVARGTSWPMPVYAAATGGSPLGNSLIADSEGRVAGWLDISSINGPMGVDINYTVGAGAPNLLLNGHFESDTVPWALGGTAPTKAAVRSTTWAAEGTASLRITGTMASAQTSYAVWPGTVGWLVPVTAGTSYRIQAAVNNAAMPASAYSNIGINWYNATPTLIGQAYSNSVVGPGLGTIASTLVAPAGAAYAQPFLHTATTGAGSTDVYYDQVGFYAASGAVLPGTTYVQPIDLPSQSLVWTSPSYQNGWTDYGLGFGGAAYTKTAEGLVILRGLIKSGTVGADAFQLPAGFRLATQREFNVLANSAVGRVYITPAGAVRPNTGTSATWTSLNGISFPVT